MSTYFAVLTQVGEAKLANAIALGQTLKLKKMGVGDGNGALPIPDRLQKALVREMRRADLNQLAIDPANASQIIVEQVLPENVGGWWIREIGIYDEAGDLCAVANCPPSYKPVMAEGSARTQVVRVVLIVASTAAIELKIDPSIILATRKYADDQIVEVRAYADAQLAKHLAAADPHPLLAKVAYVDQQLAKQLGNKSRTIGIPASATLTPDAAGCVFIFNGNNVEVVLPLSSTVPSGAEISFMSSNASGCSIARQGADKLVNGNSNFLTSMALAVGDTATFVCSKNEGWYLRDGSLSLPYSARFGAALATQGYQKLPSGKIEQWGQVSSDATGTAIVAFLIAFPSAAHFVVPLEINSGAGYATATQITPGSFRIHFWNAAGGPAPAGVLANWFALGS